MTPATVHAPFLHVVIPGEPLPQPRPRARLVPALAGGAVVAAARRARSVRDLYGLFRPQVYTAESTGASRVWRARVEAALELARRPFSGASPIAGKGEPIEVFLLFVLPLAPSRFRRRGVPRAWCTLSGRGDFDNLAKLICDAANGVLWPDDCQVARAVVEKVVGAQGEAARVELLARRVCCAPDETLFAAVASGRGWSPAPAPRGVVGGLF